MKKKTLETEFEEQRAEAQAKADAQDNDQSGERMKMYYLGKADAHERDAEFARIEREFSANREGGQS